MRRLAEGMFPITRKYMLFGDAPNVNPILLSFQANYEKEGEGLFVQSTSLKNRKSFRNQI